MITSFCSVKKWGDKISRNYMKIKYCKYTFRFVLTIRCGGTKGLHLDLHLDL